METFSQRKGIKSVKAIQIDSMDKDLRNRLWNALYIFYLKYLKKRTVKVVIYEKVDFLLKELWNSYFKRTIDTMGSNLTNIYNEIRVYFFACKWYEVYDLIEFIANNYPDKEVNNKFINSCNLILEQESSAYRFVRGRITQITSEIEISEVEEALKNSKHLESVNVQLERALELLSDRKSPDYRNSIKESIGAVESICKLIIGDKKATLNEALNKLENKVNLHPALKKAFSNLYGYTSDANGIRHGLLTKPNLSFEDAKFMLVSCSAFINYLIAKNKEEF